MKWDIIAPFAIYMVITLVAAFWAQRAVAGAMARGGKFLEEFFVAGRSVGPWVLAFTFMATFASAGTFIGYPGLAYNNGLTVVMTGINQITMAYLAYAVIGKRMAVIGHRTGAVTFVEVIRNRFDHPLVAVGAAIAIIIFFIAFMVGQYAGAARILEATMGVPYAFGVFLFGGIVTLSVVLGGFRGVAWTDVIQGVFMLLGLIIVFPAFVVLGGGFEKITTKLVAESPGLVFGPGPKEWLPPSMLISFWILWVWLAVANPATAVRFLAAKDSKTLHQGIIIGSVMCLIFYVPMFYMGAGIRTIFPGLKPDVAIPSLYLAALPGWMAGLALAAPFAAVMSTVDSLLLEMSGTVVRDVYHRYINPKADHRSLARLSYIVSGVLGILALVLALTPPPLIANIVIYFGGGVMSAFVVPIIAALYWRWATTPGAIAAIFGGFLTFMIIDVFYKNPFKTMSYVWGVLASFVLLCVVSKLTKPTDKATLDLYYGKPKGVPAAAE